MAESVTPARGAAPPGDRRVHERPCSGGRAWMDAHPRGESLRASAKATQNRSLAELRAVEDGYELLQGAAARRRRGRERRQLRQSAGRRRRFRAPGRDGGARRREPGGGAARRRRAQRRGGADRRQLGRRASSYSLPVRGAARDAVARGVRDEDGGRVGRRRRRGDGCTTSTRASAATPTRRTCAPTPTRACCARRSSARPPAARELARRRRVSRLRPRVRRRRTALRDVGAWASHAAEIAGSSASRACYARRGARPRSPRRCPTRRRACRAAAKSASGALTWADLARRRRAGCRSLFAGPPERGVAQQRGAALRMTTCARSRSRTHPPCPGLGTCLSGSLSDAACSGHQEVRSCELDIAPRRQQRQRARADGRRVARERPRRRGAGPNAPRARTRVNAREAVGGSTRRCCASLSARVARARGCSSGSTAGPSSAPVRSANGLNTLREDTQVRCVASAPRDTARRDARRHAPLVAVDARAAPGPSGRRA